MVLSHHGPCIDSSFSQEDNVQLSPIPAHVFDILNEKKIINLILLSPTPSLEYMPPRSKKRKVDIEKDHVVKRRCQSPPATTVNSCRTDSSSRYCVNVDCHSEKCRPCPNPHELVTLAQCATYARIAPQAIFKTLNEIINNDFSRVMSNLVFEYVFVASPSGRCFLCITEFTSPLIEEKRRRQLKDINCAGAGGICNEHGAYKIRARQIKIRQNSISNRGDCAALDLALNVTLTGKEYLPRFQQMYDACLKHNRWINAKQAFHLLHRVMGFDSHGGHAQAKPVLETPDRVEFFVKAFCLGKTRGFTYADFGETYGGIDGTFNKYFDSAHFNEYRWEELPLEEMRRRVEAGPAHPQNILLLGNSRATYQHEYENACKRGFRAFSAKDVEFLQIHHNLLISWYQLRHLW